MAFVLDMVGCEWGASMQRHELVDHCNFRKYNQNYELRHSQKLHGNFTSFLRNLDLSEGAALDLVAVLAGGELLVVGLVLAGDESFGKLESRALGQTNIASKGTDFTGDFLHALFALNNCGVDFIDTFNNIGPGVYIIFSMTLPSHTAERDKGGEEEREASQNEDSHNDGGKVGKRFFWCCDTVSRFWCTIRRSSGLVGGSRGTISWCRLLWGCIRGLLGGSIAGRVSMGVGTISFQESILSDFEGTGSSQAQSSNGGFSEHCSTVDG